MFSFNQSHLKWFQLWWWIGWGWVALVWYLSLTSNPVEIDLGTAFNDKIGHTLAYCWLMLWFGNLYHCRHGRISYAIIFIIMGAGLEALQGMNPARQFGIDDMLANAVGVILGFIITIGKARQGLQFLEKLLVKAA